MGLTQATIAETGCAELCTEQGARKMTLQDQEEERLKAHERLKKRQTWQAELRGQHDEL
jgi:hypothetical protein